MLPFELTKDTPYLALSGELWSVFYEYFTEIDRVIKGFYCMTFMTWNINQHHPPWTILSGMEPGLLKSTNKDINGYTFILST